MTPLISLTRFVTELPGVWSEVSDEVDTSRLYEEERRMIVILNSSHRESQTVTESQRVTNCCRQIS